MGEEKKAIPTSRLRGWDYIQSLMENCPTCGNKATLGTDALNGKYRVCCMNICCSNMTNYEDNYWGRAIVKWNNYVKGRKF